MSIWLKHPCQFFSENLKTTHQFVDFSDPTKKIETHTSKISYIWHATFVARCVLPTIASLAIGVVCVINIPTHLLLILPAIGFILGSLFVFVITHDSVQIEYNIDCLKNNPKYSDLLEKQADFQSKYRKFNLITPDFWSGYSLGLKPALSIEDWPLMISLVFATLFFN